MRTVVLSFGGFLLPIVPFPVGGWINITHFGSISILMFLKNRTALCSLACNMTMNLYFKNTYESSFSVWDSLLSGKYYLENYESSRTLLLNF